MGSALPSGLQSPIFLFEQYPAPLVSERWLPLQVFFIFLDSYMPMPLRDKCWRKLYSIPPLPKFVLVVTATRLACFVTTLGHPFLFTS